mmetsp:Transcript_15045/g.40360  ORF Transcript_15045/g.40360 Transcript_15045/m.40360 type:complete len:227 (+) Transcript_15045:318-998(+)
MHRGECHPAGRLPKAEREQDGVQANGEHLSLLCGVHEARRAQILAVPDRRALREPGHECRLGEHRGAGLRGAEGGWLRRSDAGRKARERQRAHVHRGAADRGRGDADVPRQGQPRARVAGRHVRHEQGDCQVQCGGVVGAVKARHGQPRRRDAGGDGGHEPQHRQAGLRLSITWRVSRPIPAPSAPALGCPGKSRVHERHTRDPRNKTAARWFNRCATQRWAMLML